MLLMLILMLPRLIIISITNIMISNVIIIDTIISYDDY